ncbi:MAG: signal peptidase I [Gammaproteobacteria bacterium]|nr:signal peptidase I [Gammaproteobacteria bacterium]
MNFDFALFLVVATFVCGIIWALDAWLWAPRRRARLDQASPQLRERLAHERDGREPVLVEYARSLFPVFLIVLLLRSFLAEPFRIPSNSMMPTLLTGDFILVNKFTYGLRLPVLNKKFIDLGAPQRGDVVVFRYPKDPRIDYIKRVVGLPGDRVDYYHKTLTVNGNPMPQQPVGSYLGYGAGAGMTGAEIFNEDLDGTKHAILIRPGQLSGEGEFTVPEGHYFVMGDNRDNSNDSRYWGMVPDQNLVGKAVMIWMSWDWSADGVIAWRRIGTSIK